MIWLMLGLWRNHLPSCSASTTSMIDHVVLIAKKVNPKIKNALLLACGCTNCGNKVKKKIKILGLSKLVIKPCCINLMGWILGCRLLWKSSGGLRHICMPKYTKYAAPPYWIRLNSVGEWAMICAAPNRATRRWCVSASQVWCQPAMPNLRHTLVKWCAWWCKSCRCQAWAWVR